ncbi:hypothetical protein B7P43_G01923 [Cryptotermes secundus]|uniref:DUF659 domain-containing protein n=1 Tax=Cryptotermes secundus TaxID=105785 RepID=A0A2J7QLV5_9NEOP|nr:hypothetical protein B7P43_G01923 [Cryptotermes secundus]
MPKVKISQKTKLQLHQREFEGELITTDNKILYCRACEKKNIKIKFTKSAPVQKVLSEFSNNSFSQFSFDLCQALLAADILLWKLTKPTLRNFIEKYTQCKVPDESTVRKNYVKQCYDLSIVNITDNIQDNFAWVSIDETQDYEGRFNANCIVVSINKNEPSLPYLLAVEQFETTNSSAVSGFFPPKPILTRWDTWLCAVSCYTEQLKTVRNVVNIFDLTCAASIQIAQDVLNT